MTQEKELPKCQEPGPAEQRAVLPTVQERMLAFRLYELGYMSLEDLVWKLGVKL